MAAGVTLERDRLGDFRAFMEEALSPAVEQARRDNGLLVDGAVTASGFNFALADMLSRAGPYGAGNPEPVLALPTHVLAFAEPVGESHVRARFRSGDGKTVNAVAFRAVGQPLGNALYEYRGRTLHVAGHIAIDTWQGEQRVQMRVMDVAAA